jgi:hypothetical protein
MSQESHLLKPVLCPVKLPKLSFAQQIVLYAVSQKVGDDFWKGAAPSSFTVNEISDTTGLKYHSALNAINTLPEGTFTRTKKHGAEWTLTYHSTGDDWVGGEQESVNAPQPTYRRYRRKLKRLTVKRDDSNADS